MSPTPCPVESGAGSFAHGRRHTDTAAGGENQTASGRRPRPGALSWPRCSVRSRQNPCSTDHRTTTWSSAAPCANALGDRRPPPSPSPTPPTRRGGDRGGRAARQRRGNRGCHCAPEPVVMNAAKPQADAMVLPGNGVPGVKHDRGGLPRRRMVRVSSTVRGPSRRAVPDRRLDARRAPRGRASWITTSPRGVREGTGGRRGDPRTGHRRRGGTQRRRRGVRLPPRVTSTAGHPIGRLCPSGLAGRKRAQRGQIRGQQLGPARPRFAPRSGATPRTSTCSSRPSYRLERDIQGRWDLVSALVRAVRAGEGGSGASPRSGSAGPPARPRR